MLMTPQPVFCPIMAQAGSDKNLIVFQKIELCTLNQNFFLDNAY